MKTIGNDRVSILVDERFPRIHSFVAPDGAKVLGEVEAIPPRVYVWRKADKLTLTSDDPQVDVSYTFSCNADKACWHGVVRGEGAVAVEFDLALTLKGDDAVLRLENVKESAIWRLLTVRLPRLVAAGSQDEGSMVVTCGWQGRLLDPKKCKPQLIDYNWVGFTARLCGAAYGPDMMVTLDVPGYEDLLIQEVRQYSRIANSLTVASLGAEMTYRQRTVEDPKADVGIFPPPEKCPPLVDIPEPIRCTQVKEARLHVIRPAAGQTLDWPDAARYFQSLLPAGVKCNPYYDNALVYKTLQANIHKPRLSVEQAVDFIRRVNNLTDGVRQIVYMTGFQYIGHDSGWPDVSVVYDRVGTKEGVRQAIIDARQYNTELSFHLNYDVFSDTSPLFDGRYVTRLSTGKIGGQGMWDGNQLYGLCIPAYRPQLCKLLDKVIAEYGIRDTVHLDTYSCAPYVYDASPDHPYCGYDLTQAKLDFIKEFNKRGLDMTSEGLTDPYLGHIGHAWAMFDYGQVWEGEERIPFAHFIYHGAISYNGGHGFITLTYFADKPGIEDNILGILLSGGGLGIEIPGMDENMNNLADLLYLTQPPYMMLRNRKMTNYRREGSVRRIDYSGCHASGDVDQKHAVAGAESFIEIDPAKPGYRVVVDGRLVAEDFKTVFEGTKKDTLLAFAREDCDLDWPAPQGWTDGPLAGLTLTEDGPGIRVPATIENGRLKVKLQAHKPVRLETA